MTLRRLQLATLAATALLTTAGCGGPPDDPADLGDPGGSSATSSPVPTTNPGASESASVPGDAASGNQPVNIAHGVTLRPGVGGRLPVTVRWVQALSAPEAFAVERDVVYAADEVAWAFRLADGSVKWEARAPSDEGLAASGGVVIGLDGSRRVRIWAPFEYDLIADRNTGRLVALRAANGRTVPAGMKVLPAPAPTRYRVTAGLQRVVARRPDGAVAWSINIDEPWFDGSPAVAVPGGLVLLTSSGHLVALDYR